MPHKHPDEFYTVHAIFPTLECQPWGGLTDGPCSEHEARVAVYDHYRDAGSLAPSHANLRVFRVMPSVSRAFCVTDKFIDVALEAQADELARHIETEGWAAE